ncbi:MAG: hypothetical protein H8D23_11815 [Candidatus Brocadiales bacterium]|nr:hypothetical protein [Candidatus Brocadiales bacterium]
MFKITGHANKVERIITGLHSFDLAFENNRKEIGFPLRTLSEWFGVAYCGKSTVVSSLAGIFAKELSSNVSLVDLEGFDPDLLEGILTGVGFEGELHSIIKEKDEETLDTLIEDLWNDYIVGIVDAVGMISPLSEREGAVGEANMGRRARIMSQFSRKAMYMLRANEEPKCVFLVNHYHPNLGGYGMNAPGGETKGYASNVRVLLSRVKWQSKDRTLPDGSYVIKGRVKKNKWGYEDREFFLFMLAGKGIHKGLTALWDAKQLKKIKIIKGIIKIGDDNYTNTKEALDKAHEGDDEFFQPFIDLLKEKKEEKDE